MANKYELHVSGMTCDSCATHVIEKLSAVDGVKKVHINSWKDGKVFVELNQGKEFSEKEIKSAFEKTNYKMGMVKTLSVLGGGGVKPKESKADFDLAIIGTGSAGMAAAIEASGMGKKVVIIEKGTIGGTCVNVGCIPSKAIIKPANLLHHARNNGFAGIDMSIESNTWEKLVAQREDLVTELRQEKYENVLKSYPQIKLIQANATFNKDKNGYPLLELDNGDSISAKKYLISTGSRPHFPDVPGVSEVEPLDSTSALFLAKKPETLIVIGGGFIALELTQAFSRLGVKIVSMEVRSRILSKWDEDISDAIMNILKTEEISVHKNTVPIKFFKKDGKKCVEMRDKDGKVRKLEADEILIATGRISNTETLNLDSIGVEKNNMTGGIRVNNFMQTSNPNVYAAGDAADIPKLVYLAAKSGKIATRHAFDQETAGLNLQYIPEVVFSDPQIARVGLSEAEAKKEGRDIRVSVLPMSAVPKAIVSYKKEGFIKLIADSNTNTLIGAHIISKNAGELIQTAFMAITMGVKYGFSIDEFKDMLFPYLTEVEGLKLAAQTFSVDVKQLSCCAG